MVSLPSYLLLADKYLLAQGPLAAGNSDFLLWMEPYASFATTNRSLRCKITTRRHQTGDDPITLTAREIMRQR
jgi:hypothetical protein